jgi:hypothetical protein
MLARSIPALAPVDDSVAPEMDASRRAARLEMLSAAVCKLRMLFVCGECGDDELMLEMDCGRGRSLYAFNSLWRVRMMDSFRRITLPSGSRDLTGCCCCCFCETGGAREMDEFEFMGSGVCEAWERLNGDKTLYDTGGCAGDGAEGWGEFARSRSRLPRDDELAPSPSDAGAAGGGKRVKISVGLPRPANCACMSSFDRRSHVGGARPAHFAWAIRLQWEHKTAPFFTGSRHTRQPTAK